MSRWDADSDLDYFFSGVLFARPCEERGCENHVDLSSTSIFCADCLRRHEDQLAAQRTRELHERRSS